MTAPVTREVRTEATTAVPPAGPAVGDGLPLGDRGARRVVLAAVFVCAACGLVYELALVALGSYLMGSSITQTSLVLSVVLCSMGLGALAAKPLSRWPVIAFAGVEVALGLVGALSVPVLYASFAWLNLYTPTMLLAALAVGALIGAEIPLLMRLVQRIRAQDASDAVADLSAADYVGALVGGLAFPFLLLPTFGLVRGSLVVGALNLTAAWVVSGWLFGRWVPRGVRRAVTGICAVATVALIAGAVYADRFEITARQALYRDPIVHVERSPYQEIVLTEKPIVSRARGDVRLFLDGDLQFSSRDEYRYHEALVHPALEGARGHVLILGGGDGLALREVLRYPDVEEVVLVDLDAAVVALGRESPRLVELNGGALDDPRVEVVAADALTWLRGAGETFDAAIVDLPDADSTETAKLYSVEFYGLVRRVLADGGRAVVQSGSPFFAPDAYWSVEASVREAGLATVPYHVDVPSFGDWGFVLAAEEPPDLAVPDAVAGELRFLDDAVLAAATVFPPDRARRPVEPSTLLDPVLLEYEREGWRAY